MKTKLQHVSLAPPALESPSRFSARGSLAHGGGPSSRSRRARTLRRLRRIGWGVLVAAVLGGVFASYFSRDMLFALASQAWSCL